MNVIGIVGAAWLLLSILLAVAWVLGGKRIFRKPPVQPQLVMKTDLSPEDAAADIIRQIRHHNRLNGGM